MWTPQFLQDDYSAQISIISDTLIRVHFCLGHELTYQISVTQAILLLECPTPFVINYVQVLLGSHYQKKSASCLDIISRFVMS